MNKTYTVRLSGTIFIKECPSLKDAVQCIKDQSILPQMFDIKCSDGSGYSYEGHSAR